MQGGTAEREKRDLKLIKFFEEVSKCMKRKKVIAIVLTLAIVASLLPMAAYAADEIELDINNGDITITATGYTQGTNTPETSHTGSYKIIQNDSSNPVSNKIIITSGEINLTISGLNIEAAGGPAIKVENYATLNVTLEGENKLTGADGYAAVSVAAGEWGNDNIIDGTQGHLVISGSGSLIAQGGDADKDDFGGGAGIGGDGFGVNTPDGGDFGIVEINGGNIEAVGGAAISTSYGAGAGIGGGGCGFDTQGYIWNYVGQVIINGGTIEATGGEAADQYFCASAGIGSGSADGSNTTSGTNLSIKITGGKVTATGGVDAAGIGGSTNGACGTIEITGGEITAIGGDEGEDSEFGGAGIGGGDNWGGEAIIIGGDAVVKAEGGGGAAGIGGGHGGFVEEIIIEGEAQVTAIGGSCYNNTYGGAGIGAGILASNGFMNINLATEKTIISYAGEGAQAIGEGSLVDSLDGKIEIGENSGLVWGLNRDNVKSALYGIEMDNAIDDEKLTLGSHGLYWYNGDSENQAYYWDINKDAADNSIFTWTSVNNILSIFDKSQQSIAAQEYDSNYFAGSGSWALIGTADKSGSGGSGTAQIHTLHYETNGGNEIASESKNGTWAKLFNTLPTPKRNGYDFVGWYFDRDLTRPVTDSFSVDLVDVTIYAKWTKIITDPDDNGVADILDTRNHISYLNGYEDGSFAADKIMTRAEVAGMFYNLLLNKDVPQTVYFTDVAEEDWYGQAVNTLASMGILKGVGNNLYAPNQPITRAEFTAIAMRFGQLESGGENIFSDVNSDDWYYDAVVGSVKYGWISGYSDGTFRPNAYITRAEVTSIVNRMLNRQADKQFIDNNRASIRQFYDLTDKYWAYYEIMEAVNSHEYTTTPEESWVKLNN